MMGITCLLRHFDALTYEIVKIKADEVASLMVVGLHCINKTKSEGASPDFRRSNFWYGN